MPARRCLSRAQLLSLARWRPRSVTRLWRKLPEARLRRLRRLTWRRPSHPRAFLDLAQLLLREHLGDEWRLEASFACKRHLEIAEARRRQTPGLTEGSLRIELAKHLLCAIQQVTPAQIAPSYVSSLFDRHADSFDASLESLSYQVPQLLVQAILWSRQAQEETGSFKRILDLGAGTGLLGEKLRDLSPRAHVVAVDLSAQMLRKAQARACYSELHCSEITRHLSDCARCPVPFDLIAAADVFGYVTDLSSVFDLVLQNLEKNGLFVFSIEELAKSSSTDYQLEGSGRVSHRHEYILSLAQKHHFQVLRDTSCELRNERGHPVVGRVFSLSPEGGR